MPSSRALPRSTTTRAMAFIAIDEATGHMLGVVRIHADPNFETAEYAILIRSDLKGHGLGWLLMELIIEYARAEGLQFGSRPSAARKRRRCWTCAASSAFTSRPIRRTLRSLS